MLCGISTPFGVLFPTARQVTHALLTRPPLRHSIHSTVEAQRFFILSNFLASHLHHSVNRVSPFDLHVLGAPPAFVLSQDQTLEKLYLNTLSSVKIIFQAKSQLVSKKLKINFPIPRKVDVQGSFVLSFQCCLIFKVRCRHVTAWLSYHNPLDLSSTFFKFFKTFFGFAFLKLWVLFRSVARSETALLYYHHIPQLSTPFFNFFNLFFRAQKHILYMV